MLNGTIKIIPLGGVGEIGKNCTVIEYEQNILVIDVGLMFPETEMLGIDLVIPDFSYLIERRDQIRGIVFTHGHEDHIGALSYLLEHVTAPIYATPLTRGLIEAKLRREHLLDGREIHTMAPDKEIALGPFRVTPFHVNHSIPDAVGLAIRTPLGLIVHTGDFKIDHTPLESRTTDLSVLARLANEGVILLMADSTNAESPGYTASESQLIDTFHRVFSRAKGRIIVATFASLLSRIQLVIETAAQFGRKVAVAGRSMEENIAIAEELGYVHFPANTRVPLSSIERLSDEQVCVIATGAQGEPNAALARMASGRFRFVQIKEGDTVMLSSKAIPGNETQVYRNIDNLFRRGATVVYGEQAGIHVSGHASQEELKLMLNLLRPLYFMPVHGEYRMLKTHALLAQELGFAKEDIFVLDNGYCLELDDKGARMGEAIELQNVFVDGLLVGDVGNTILRDRMALSQDGVVIARVSIESETGQVIDDPQIISQGFVYVPESAALIESAELAIIDAVEHFDSNGHNGNGHNGNGNGHDAPTDVILIGQRIKRRLEKLFYDETHRRPVVIPMVTKS